MIYTFYSFKGGVGRSMALANVAELFCRFGLKVLMVDFDLEAPGLERYFHSAADHQRILAQRGVVDMLVSYKEMAALLAVTSQHRPSDLSESSQLSQSASPDEKAAEHSSLITEPIDNFCILLKRDSKTGGELSLISAGRRDEKYFDQYTQSIQSFDWNDFYVNWKGEQFFDWFCEETKRVADVVLIDSRTGITEMGGTCTHQIADCVLLFVGANQQNLKGTSRMVDSLSNPDLVTRGRGGRPLRLLPIPSRIENAEGDSLNEFAKQFKQHFGHLDPYDIPLTADLFTDLKIPYVPYYAYQERVATQAPNNENAKDLVLAFDRIASIMAQLAPKGSHVRQVVELQKGKREIPQNLPRSGVARFVGREQALTDLQQMVGQYNSGGITAITGTAGVGKTELALQYAIAQYRARKYPGGLCWLKARDSNIAEQIVSFAVEKLDLKLPNTDPIGRAQACWQHWPAGKVLVVIDDVEDYGAIAPYLPSVNTQFDILVTTRLSLGGSVQTLPIQELNRKGAVDLLNSFVESTRIQTQIEKVQELCERVGYLPLALELLGRFLARRLDLSVSALLDRVQQNVLSESSLATTSTGMTAPLGVANALDLSWRSLNVSERSLMCLLGLFAPMPIPWNLVEKCSTHLDLADLEGIRDDGLVARSLLVRLGESTYQMPRLVRDFARLKLSEQQDSGDTFKVAFRSGMVEAAQNMEQLVSIKPAHELRQITSHLEETVSQLADTLSRTDYIAVVAGIGHFYASQGRFSIAEPWYEKGLALTQQMSEEASAESTAHILNKLAVVYSEQGKYDEAEPLYKKALATRRRQLGTVHPDVASSLNNLASLYNAQGRYDEAEQMFREALAMRRQMWGDGHTDVASSLNNLATLYDMKGDLAQAEQLYLESLKLNRQILGEAHPNVATSLYNLAELYRTERKYAQAASLYREALSLRKRTLDKDHPDIAITDRRLQTLYRTMRGQ